MTTDNTLAAELRNLSYRHGADYYMLPASLHSKLLAALRTTQTDSADNTLAAELEAADYEYRGAFGREKHRIIPPLLFDAILTALRTTQTDSAALAGEVEGFLEELDAWEKAYPLAYFPEPDLRKADAVLKDAGISLGAISASNMRHVVSRIAPHARKAISALRQPEPDNARLLRALDLLAICRVWLEPDAVYTMSNRNAVLADIDATLASTDSEGGE